jgi:hypothetical protein
MAAGLALVLPSVAARAGTIYYQHSPTAAVEIWSMNDDGTNKVLQCTVGSQTVPIGAVAVSGLAYGTVPGTQLPARRFLTIIQTGTFGSGNNYGELSYFTPDGQGGAAWRQITTFAASGWYLMLPNCPQFSNDGKDAFVSAVVLDQSVAPTVVRLVRIHIGGADPGSTLVTPADPRVEVVLTLPDGYKNPFLLNVNLPHSWSPDGSRFVYVYSFPVLNPNGTTAYTDGQLIVRTVNGGTQTVLGDGHSSGLAFYTPRWSPLPGSQTVSFSSGGIYLIDTVAGALKVLIQSDASHQFDSLVWSSDAQNLAMEMITGSGPWTYNVGRVSALVPTRSTKVTNLTNVKTATYYDDARFPIAWR